jgi:triacylglycerol lipase
MGQSAGAVHAAGYVTAPNLHGTTGRALAGAVLISGIYDIAIADRNDFQRAYFGDDTAKWREFSTVAALAQADLPMLVSVSELDGDDFQRQAAALVAARTSATNRFPRLVYLTGHNHLSSVLQIGLPLDTLGPAIEEFIATTCGTR